MTRTDPAPTQVMTAPVVEAPAPRRRPGYSRRLRVAAAVAAAVAIVVGALTATRMRSVGGLDLKVAFPSAVSLYPQSTVMIMGLPAGKVLSVQPAGDHINVVLHVDHGIPVPADVNASIVPLSLIGERNVVLYPAWHEGEPQATNGMTIPPSRASVPVEPDQALAAFTKLAKQLDPNAIRSLITNGAATFAGNEPALNQAISQMAALSSTFAAGDQSMLATARHIHDVAQTLNSRQQQVAETIDGFAAATDILATERNQIQQLLAGIAGLTTQGQRLLNAHRSQLPADFADMAGLGLALQANVGGLQQFLSALPTFSSDVVRADDAPSRALLVSGAESQIVRDLISPANGGQQAPCFPTPDARCTSP